MRTGFRLGLVIIAVALAIFFFCQTQAPGWAISPGGRDLIRLHIVAHSDGASDQALKLRVRDQIVEQTAALFASCHSELEAERLLRSQLKVVEEISDQVLEEAGASYRSRAELGAFPFPERTYQDLRLPQGRYRALKIILGAGQGHNWWCVLFPPLCFVDGSSGEAVVPVTGAATDSQAEAQEVMAGGPGVEKNDAVEEKAEKVEIRFKVVEMWEKVRPRTLLSWREKE